MLLVLVSTTWLLVSVVGGGPVLPDNLTIGSCFQDMVVGFHVVLVGPGFQDIVVVVVVAVVVVVVVVVVVGPKPSC